MALKNKIHFDIDTLETIADTQGQAIDTLEGQASSADDHIVDLNNPHQVTAAQVGAVTQSELTNAITAVVEDLDWKEMVPTFADLAIEYPDPDQGWTASVAADNVTYRYDGTQWVPILGALSPLATANNNGLITKEDFIKLLGVEPLAKDDQSAAEVPFDNQETNLTSSSVQGALEELDFTKLDATALSTTLAFYSTDAPSDILAPSFRLVTSISDPDYPVSPVNINTPAIEGQNQPVGQLVSDPGVIIGNPGVISINTIGQIRKISGNANQNAHFYYEVYRYDGVLEQLEAQPTATSNVTPTVTSTSYEQFFASAVFNNGVFGPLDRIVIRYYADQVDNSGAVYQFQFGGENPVRTLFPVPVEVIPAPDASKIFVDTGDFDGLLDGNDNTVQQALDTLDDHNHDLLYFRKDQLRPLTIDPEDPQSLIEDFEAAAQLDGRYIKTDDLGETVQPFDANTVVDANYNNFNPSGTYPILRAQATTKGDVGLSNVANFNIANENEAKAGISNLRYMTPLRTKNAILELSPPTDLSGVEGRLDTIEGSGAGSITKSLNDAKDYTDIEITGVESRLDVIEGVGEGSIAKAAADTLSDAQDYTDAEILNAQLNLGNNYSVATITERDNLTNLAVGDIVFVANDGDGKWAQYKVTALNPLAFLKVMDQDIFLNAIDAPAIKSAYESNANTNAFTDAEQSKLVGIEAGAEVNPSAADIKTAYESNADTNAFTDAEQSKLAGIEAGAEVNLSDSDIKIAYENNADTNAFTDNDVAQLGNLDGRVSFLEQLTDERAEFLLYEATVDSNNWQPVGNLFVNSISLDPTQELDLKFTGAFYGFPEPQDGIGIEVDQATINFLPPTTFTLSSTSQTGPITLTKPEGDGEFNSRWVGIQLFFGENNFQTIARYVVGNVIGPDELTVYWAGEGQLTETEFVINQQSANVVFTDFVRLIQNQENEPGFFTGNFIPQLNQFINPLNVIHRLTMGRFNYQENQWLKFNVPNGLQLQSLNPIDPVGQIYIALILDNEAYTANAQGLRKIAFVDENNDLFFNASQDYFGENFIQFGQGGNNQLEIVASQIIAAQPFTRNTAADWAASPVLPDTTNVSGFSFAFGLQPNNENGPTQLFGMEIEFSGDLPFTENDHVLVDLRITTAYFSDSVNIDREWSKIKGASSQTNGVLNLVATEAPSTPIEIQIGVIK